MSSQMSDTANGAAGDNAAIAMNENNENQTETPVVEQGLPTNQIPPQDINVDETYDEDDDYYSVEKILDKRLTDDGKLEYFIKWVGYAFEDSTWEPISNLDCATLVEAYETSIGNTTNSTASDIPMKDNTDVLMTDNTNVPKKDITNVSMKDVTNVPMVDNTNIPKKDLIDVITLDDDDDDENIGIPIEKIGEISIQANINLPLQDDMDLTTQDDTQVTLQGNAQAPLQDYDSNDVIMVDITNDDENIQEPEVVNVGENDVADIDEPIVNENGNEVDDLITYNISSHLEPQNIVGITDIHGELMFLIKWQNIDQANLVPSRIANIRWPQTVIQFYEERLTFNN